MGDFPGVPNRPIRTKTEFIRNTTCSELVKHAVCLDETYSVSSTHQINQTFETIDRNIETMSNFKMLWNL